MGRINIQDKNYKPTMDEINDYIGNPLFNDLITHIEKEYGTKPEIAYSGCSIQPGWNINIKRADVPSAPYPMEDFFYALLVVGERERDEVEFRMSGFTDYTRNFYDNTKTGMGQRWLMMEIRNDEILDDLKELIAIRRNSKTKEK